MPFYFLIIIMLMAIAIPVFFVIRENRRDTKSLTNLSQDSTLHNQPHNQSNNQTKNKTINVNLLPSIYQQVLIDIEKQFTKIIKLNNTDKLNHELWFSTKKMFYQRLPEILEDYLQLDSQYARNNIVDDVNQLTSYDITLQQLKSILNYFHQISQFSSHKNIQNILTNQRYLNSVYTQVGMQSQLTNIQNFSESGKEIAIDNDKNNKNDYSNTDYIAGQQYVNDYCIHQPNLSQPFIADIGNLIYLASITQMAVQDHLQHELSKLNISSEFGLESLEKLLVIQLPSELALIDSQQKKEQDLKIPFNSLTQLLEQMLTTLDKDIRLDIKLYQLREIDNKIWQLVGDKW